MTTLESQPEFRLSPEQKAQFEAEGCLIIPGFFTKATADKLLNRAKDLLEEFTLDDHPMTVFATTEEKKHVGDDYFLTSGDKIRFFFESDAFTDGKLNRPKELAVNKIGHALHELDPTYRKFTLENPSITNLVRDLGLHQDPRVIQSMVICKQKEVGGAVGSHDDSTFLYTKPLSAVGLWFALEDCTAENGCLSFVKGSHKANPIVKRLVRVDGGKGGTRIEKVEGVEPGRDWEAEDVEWTVAPVDKGDLVLIHGSVIHRSEKNLSQKSRFIYTFHMVDDAAVWDELNWLQPTPEMPFTKLYQ